ncbi:hypothetical protein AMS20_18005 [Acetobacter orientalis]|uniref:Uncharacterized protein n=1 Tax=Acetobacter orientalis TaxID=146474 RepID=A0A2Z5ZKA3_9PROT|nr:hypothetical protein AMS20_18005 [Acetobacter orientalis]
MQPVQWGMAMLARNLVTLQCMGSQLGYAKGEPYCLGQV